VRGRMHLVPFTVTIPVEKRDEALAEKLKQEWPGILQWMIDGCLDWQAEQLSPPEAVRSATEQYLEAEDAMATWIDECCTTRPDDETTTAALFASWSTWANKAGEFVGSMKRFSQNLQARGFEPKRNSLGKSGFRGIRATPPATVEFDYASRY
jgi:putative DNA primase/helicase